MACCGPPGSNFHGAQNSREVFSFASRMNLLGEPLDGQSTSHLCVTTLFSGKDRVLDLSSLNTLKCGIS